MTVAKVLFGSLNATRTGFVRSAYPDAHRLGGSHPVLTVVIGTCDLLQERIEPLASKADAIV